MLKPELSTQLVMSLLRKQNDTLSSEESIEPAHPHALEHGS